MPAHKLKDLIALAKSKPGTLNFSSPGLASTTFIAGALFRKAAGLDIVHVPFKSAPDAVTAVVRGDAHMYFAPVNLAMEMNEAGKVIAIAAATPKRIAELPNVPTFTEAGLPFIYNSWFGLMAQAAVPKPIIQKINKDIAESLKSADVAAKLEAQFVVPVTTRPRSSTRSSARKPRTSPKCSRKPVSATRPQEGLARSAGYRRERDSCRRGVVCGLPVGGLGGFKLPHPLGQPLDFVRRQGHQLGGLVPAAILKIAAAFVQCLGECRFHALRFPYGSRSKAGPWRAVIGPKSANRASPHANRVSRSFGPAPARLGVTDHALDRRERPPQRAFDLVDLLVHVPDGQHRVDAAVEIDDLALGRLAHADVVDLVRRTLCAP